MFRSHVQQLCRRFNTKCLLYYTTIFPILCLHLHIPSWMVGIWCMFISCICVQKNINDFLFLLNFRSFNEFTPHIQWKLRNANQTRGLQIRMEYSRIQKGVKLTSFTPPSCCCAIARSMVSNLSGSAAILDDC